MLAVCEGTSISVKGVFNFLQTKWSGWWESVQNYLLEFICTSPKPLFLSRIYLPVLVLYLYLPLWPLFFCPSTISLLELPQKRGNAMCVLPSRRKSRCGGGVDIYTKKHYWREGRGVERKN